MNKYTKPTAEIIVFSVEDIITQSGNASVVNGAIIDSGALSGEEKTMYEIYSQNSSSPSTNVSIFTW